MYTGARKQALAILEHLSELRSVKESLSSKQQQLSKVELQLASLSKIADK